MKFPINCATSLELLLTVLSPVVIVKVAMLALIANNVHLIISYGEVKILTLKMVLVSNVVSSFIFIFSRIGTSYQNIFS